MIAIGLRFEPMEAPIVRPLIELRFFVEEPPDLVAKADTIMEGREPDRIEPIPADYQPPSERDEENPVGVSVWRKRLGCPGEYLSIRPNTDFSLSSSREIFIINYTLRSLL